MTPPGTGAEALAWARERLRRAGVEGAPRDARLLLAHALALAPGRLTAELGAPLGAAAFDRFAAAIGRRAAREPVSHILGGRWFYKHWFEVTRDTLDPRPETELIVERALREPFAAVLDLGTGTGCILLSLLAARCAARGIGTDTSEAALAVARGNAERLGLQDRAALRRADWFEGVEGVFDLIVSNPPYIAAHEIAGLAPELRDWEPRAALSDGGDGLSAYRAIAAGAGAHLARGGRLIVEIGHAQGAAVAAILRHAGLDGVAVHPDLDGRDRAVSARKP